MHYSYVSACPWFYPFGLPMALSMCYLVLIQNLCILHRNQLNFIMHHCTMHWSLKNRLTLDLSHYIWKSLLEDMSGCNFFFIVTFSIIVPEICKMCNLSWKSLKLCGNDQMMHCLWKNFLRSSGNALQLCFTFPRFYPFHLPMALSMWYLSWFRTFAFCIEISWIFARITVPLLS